MFTNGFLSVLVTSMCLFFPSFKFVVCMLNIIYKTCVWYSNVVMLDISSASINDQLANGSSNWLQAA